MGNVPQAHLVAPFKFIENLDLLSYNPGMADGCIVLYYEATVSIHKIRQQNQLAGLIRMGKPNFPAIALNAPQKNFEGISPIPMVSVTYEQACELKKYSGQEMSLKVDQGRFHGEAQNIVVKIPGTEEGKNQTYAVAHYDTTPGNHGAADNGAGTVNLLSVIHYFTQHPPKSSLICIFFSGEELGLCGSEAFVKQMSDTEKEQARLVVNIDMSGEPIGSNVFMVTGSTELKGYVGAVAREEGYLFRESLDIYSSDNMPFVYEEIPAVSIARWGGPAVAGGHSAKDVVENIDADGLKQTSGAAIAILKRILNAKIYPVRREIDSGLRAKIERYQYFSRKQIPVLNWRKEYEK